MDFRRVVVILIIGSTLTFIILSINVKTSLIFFESQNQSDVHDGIISSCIVYDSSERCVCAAAKNATVSIVTHLYDTSAPLTPIPEARCVMTVSPTGRLGNLMGQYATLYALSKLNGRPAFLLPEMANELNPYFNLSIPAMNQRLIKTSWSDHVLEDVMKPEYGHLRGRFVRLMGYPCSWTFYHHLEDEIKREFAFHSHIIEEVNAYLAFLKKNRASVTYVGVHIRRGDYVRLMAETYDGVLADAEYLAKAMGYFKSKYSDALFVVCSDDLEWARKNIHASDQVVFGWFGANYSPGHDIALLSKCNHTIMTMGTFGYWAAYLAGGEVIYFTNYTREGSKWHTVFSDRKNLLPDWKGIGATNLEAKRAQTWKILW